MIKSPGDALKLLCALLVECEMLEDVYADAAAKLLHAKTRVHHQKLLLADMERMITQADDPKRKSNLQTKHTAQKARLADYERELTQREQEFAHWKSSKTSFKHTGPGSTTGSPKHQ